MDFKAKLDAGLAEIQKAVLGELEKQTGTQDKKEKKETLFDGKLSEKSYEDTVTLSGASTPEAPKAADAASSSTTQTTTNNQNLELDRNGNPLTGFIGDNYYENGLPYTGPLFGFEYVNGVRQGKSSTVNPPAPSTGDDPVKPKNKKLTVQITNPDGSVANVDLSYELITSSNSPIGKYRVLDKDGNMVVASRWDIPLKEEQIPLYTLYETKADGSKVAVTRTKEDGSVEYVTTNDPENAELGENQEYMLTGYSVIQKARLQASDGYYYTDDGRKIIIMSDLKNNDKFQEMLQDGTLRLQKEVRTQSFDDEGHPIGETKTWQTTAIDDIAEIKEGETTTPTTAEVGSMEYIEALIKQVPGFEKFNLSYFRAEQTDGKVTKLYSTANGVNDFYMNYNISYGNDGKVIIQTVNTLIPDAPVQNFTFQNGELIQTEKIENGNGQIKTITDYANGKKTQITKTFDGAAIQDGVAKVVTTYDASGKIVSETEYDSDGNVINQTEAPQKGSAGYIAQLLGNNIEFKEDEWKFATDTRGNVIKIEPKETENSSGRESTYEISYKSNGQVEIKEIPNQRVDGAVEHTKIFNADGKLIKETHPANASLGPSAYSGERIYNADGSSVYTKTYVNPEAAGAAKEVITYDKNGNIVSSKRYDAQGELIVEKQEIRDNDGKLLYTILDKNKDKLPSIVNGKIKFSDTKSIDIPTSDEWIDIEITKDGFVSIIDNKDGNITGYDKNGNATGSKEYLAGVLGIDISKMDEVELKDGKVTYFIDKSTYSSGLIEYEIEYGNNNSWTVTIKKDGKVQEKKTLNLNTEVIGYEKHTDKGIETYQSSGDGKGTSTGKSSDGKTTNWTVVDNFAGDSRPHIYAGGTNASVAQITFADKVWVKIQNGQTATINEDGSVEVKDKNGNVIYNFDKDGLQIVDNKKTRASEVGSAAYIQKLLKQDFALEDATANVRYDSEGRIISFIDRGAEGNDYNTYTISYKDGKISEINLTKTDGTKIKYDSTGKEVSSVPPNTGGSTGTTNPTQNPTIEKYPSGKIKTKTTVSSGSLIVGDTTSTATVKIVEQFNDDAKNTSKSATYTALTSANKTNWSITCNKSTTTFPKVVMNNSVDAQIKFSDSKSITVINGERAVINADGSVLVYSNNNKKIEKYDKNGNLIQTKTINTDGSYYTSTLSSSPATHETYQGFSNGNNNANYTATDYYHIPGKTYSTDQEYPCVKNETSTEAYLYLKKNDRVLLKNGMKATISSTGSVYIRKADGTMYGCWDKDGNARGTVAFLKNIVTSPDLSDMKNIKYETVTEGGASVKRVTQFELNGKTYKVSYTSGGSTVLKRLDSNSKVVQTLKYHPFGGKMENIRKSATTKAEWGFTSSDRDGANRPAEVKYYSLDKDGKSVYTVFDHLKGGNKPKMTSYDASSLTITLANDKTVVVKDGQTADIKADGTVEIKDKNGKVIKKFDAKGNAVAIVTTRT